MPKVVLDDGTELEFDNDVSDEQIHKYMEVYMRDHAPQKQEQQPEEKDWRSNPIVSGLAGAAKGATLGFGDELAGLITAGGKKVFGSEQEQQMPFGDLYRQEQQAAQAGVAESMQANPWTATGGEIVGSIPSMIGGGTLVKGVGKVASSFSPKVGAAIAGATEAGGISKTAAQGAGIGAVQGAGDASTYEQIPEEMVKGAAFGGAAGAVGKGIIEPALKGIGTTIAKPIESTRERLQKALGINKEKAEAFKEADIQPTLGDISDRPVVQGFQNILKNIPVIGSKIEKATQEASQKIEEGIKKITNGVQGSPLEAGEVIQKGAKTEIARLQAKKTKLYNDVDNLIPNTTPTKITFLKAVLDEDMIDGKGFIERVAEKSHPIRQALTDIEKYLKPNQEGESTIPFEIIRSIKKDLGADLKATQGNENRAIKALYGALSEDTRSAAEATGKSAVKAYDLADKFYKTMKTRVNEKLDPILKKDTAGQVYSLATSGNKTDATKMRRTLSVLDNDQKEYVRGTLLKKMGEKAGTEGEFNMQQFMKNWNNVKDTKRQMFTPDQVKAVDNLQKIMSSATEAGTQKESGALGKAGQVGAALAGSAGATWINPYVGVPLALTGAAVGRLLMANPKAINWLAKSPVIKNTRKEQFLSAYKEWAKEGTRLATKNPEIASDVLDILNGRTIQSDQD